MTRHCESEKPPDCGYGRLAKSWLRAPLLLVTSCHRARADRERREHRFDLREPGQGGIRDISCAVVDGISHSLLCCDARRAGQDFLKTGTMQAPWLLLASYRCPRRGQPLRECAPGSQAGKPSAPLDTLRTLGDLVDYLVAVRARQARGHAVRPCAVLTTTKAPSEPASAGIDLPNIKHKPLFQKACGASVVVSTTSDPSGALPSPNLRHEAGSYFEGFLKETKSVLKGTHILPHDHPIPSQRNGITHSRQVDGDCSAHPQLRWQDTGLCEARVVLR